MCLTVWENERSTNDNLNRLLESHYLHQAYEVHDPTHGRGNRIVFLTRTGLSWVLGKGHVREQDIAFYWKGEGHWHPLYDEHNVLVHDVLCAFIKQANDQPEQVIDLRLDPYAPLQPQSIPTEIKSPLQEGSLLPDRIFGVRYQDQVIECYLEVDCGTEDKQQWQEKMHKYTLCPEIMDQDGVLVLTVAINPRRMETLLRWSRELVDHRFWFSHIDSICYTYNREGKDLLLANIGNPFGDVWHVCTDPKLRRLFRD